ncbi:uncharacterized protein LOC144671582 isoform X3 [Cetorhinus maximus]
MDFCTGKRCVMKGHLFKVLGKLKEIAIYLSNDDWTELSEWVESRYKKVQQNCENMLAVEVRLLKPQFKNEDTKKTKKENTRKAFQNQKAPSLITSHSEEDEDEVFKGFTEDTASAMEETVSVQKIDREMSTSVCESEANKDIYPGINDLIEVILFRIN